MPQQSLFLRRSKTQQAAADLSCSSNKSLRPWQCPFKEVQGCRLPARKTPQTLPCSSQAPLRPRQTFPAAPTSPWGPGSVLLRTFKAAVCQPAKLAKPSPAAPRRHSGRGRPFLQLQQVPEALAASFYGRSRLPFASPQNSPNPPLQLPGATQAAADLSCSSNKSLRPWQCPFKDVQGCRLPARKTRQTLPCSSQAPLRPRQTFPAAPTSPWGPGSVLLRTFKAAVCQPAKLAKPSPAAPRRHSGRGRPFLQLQQVPEALAASFYGCSRLPFASPQNSPNPLCSSQAPLRPRQTFPAAPTSPWGPGSVLLRTFKAAVCQPAKLAKPSPAAPRRHSGRGRPFLQLQQVPEAVAVSF